MYYQWRRPAVFIANFEHGSHLFLSFHCCFEHVFVSWVKSAGCNVIFLLRVLVSFRLTILIGDYTLNIFS